MAELITDIGSDDNAGDQWIFNPNYAAAQTFIIATGMWTITSIELLLYAFSDPDPPVSGDMTLNIRQNSPTGDILGTSTVNRNTVTQSMDPDDATWITFDFSEVELSSGNIYCLELSCPYGEAGPGLDIVFWVQDWDFYADGIKYDWDGSSWTSGDTYDLQAKVYGTAVSEGGYEGWPAPRPGTYDENQVWNPTEEDWDDINDFEYTGGGRYKNRIVVVGHGVVYFGDL